MPLAQGIAQEYDFRTNTLPARVASEIKVFVNCLYEATNCAPKSSSEEFLFHSKQIEGRGEGEEVLV